MCRSRVCSRLIVAPSDATMMYPRRLGSIGFTMHSFNSKRSFLGKLLLATVLFVSGGGCGAYVPEPTLPDKIAGFTLRDLADIQNNSALTDDQRRQQIRDATGTPNTIEGDRLVEFLLTLVIL